MSTTDNPITESSGTESAGDVLRDSKLPGLDFVRRGKVRDLYDIGEHYLIVASDRLSAFDVVLPDGIPDKGRVLTRLSLFWFDLLGVENHLISGAVEDLPESCAGAVEQLRDRFMIVQKLEIQPVECIVRGYLAGSGWAEYQRQGTVCDLPLPEGLQNSSQLPEPIFTPSTKAEEGHDENIPFSTVVDMLGEERANELKTRSLEVYSKAAAFALEHGIIIADTKFEWGIRPSTGELVLADEVLTPDSSRFWPESDYAPGRSQSSFDKQFVRDYLLSTDWDKTPPAPRLPAEVIRETSSKYREIFERLTTKSFS